MPGKAEPVRLAAGVAGVEFKDEQLPQEKWAAERKAALAPQQLPLLEVGGKTFGQSMAQMRYFGKLGGQYPTDPVEALAVDEFIDYVQEMFPLFGKIFACSTDEEKNALGATLCAEGGDLHKWVVFLDTKIGSSAFCTGDALTIADTFLFTTMVFLTCGHFAFIPKDLLAPFTNITRVVEATRGHEKVKKYYANAEGMWKIYQ